MDAEADSTENRSGRLQIVILFLNGSSSLGNLNSYDSVVGNGVNCLNSSSLNNFGSFGSNLLGSGGLSLALVAASGESNSYGNGGSCADEILLHNK